MASNMKRNLTRTAALIAAAATLSGCVSPVAGPSGIYAKPIGNAPVTANPTAYSDALVCLSSYARAHRLASPRMAVGRISDYTGKVEYEGGRKITQGASLMAMTALAKAGARQVERFDTSVSELELKYANNKLITDAPMSDPTVAGEYRKIMAGQIAGSDFHIVGGITELNYNIRSSGLDAYVGDADARDTKGILNARLYVMNVALDLRLVDTRTLEVVDVISYQKQIIGREIKAGVFDFFNGNIFDISAGEGGLEPMQLAVRALIERATLEFMTNLYGAAGPEVCLSPKDDFLNYNATTGATGGFTPAYNNLETNNAGTREDPQRWRKTGRVADDARPVEDKPKDKPHATKPDHDHDQRDGDKCCRVVSRY
ncbi:transcriptional regulator [Asticcacaulis endophyticus]|uniref:Transcriptional regulator n=2 Tax=Asticcacaulis endophyticus TaxID=1395890 RepID=A0A918UYB2_9CAUL|nr:transcriptional regulator [Asticcacaulis endophyticus]